MSTLLSRRLALLGQGDHLSLLTQCLHGIEREGLRVDAQGQLAQTAHPRALGSALTHAQITTDYSEALLEFITATHRDVAHTLDELRDILIEDVHPALYGNLLIVAGEWAGFKDEWLLPRIAEARRRPRWRRRLTRVFAGSVFDDWREVAARIEAIRGAVRASETSKTCDDVSDDASERVSP